MEISPEEIADSPGISENDLDIDTLVYLQNQKLQLIKRRDELIQKKLLLKDNIHRSKETLEHYKQQQEKYETKQKLDFYLQQNDHELSKLKDPDAGSTFLLENISVLPSTDWSVRPQMARMFYPAMSVSEQTSSTVYLDDSPIKVINFTVSSKGLPSLEIRIHSKEESISDLEIINFSEVSPLLELVSPTFCRTLRNNFVPRHKLDLLMYGYHELAQLQIYRVQTFAEIFKSYPKFIHSPKEWADSPDSFVTFLFVPFIELYVPLKDKFFTVRLIWDFNLTNPITGRLQSQLNLLIIDQNSNVLKDSASAFLRLIPQYGVFHAFNLILSNVFDISN